MCQQTFFGFICRMVVWHSYAVRMLLIIWIWFSNKLLEQCHLHDPILLDIRHNIYLLQSLLPCSHGEKASFFVTIDSRDSRDSTFAKLQVGCVRLRSLRRPRILETTPARMGESHSRRWSCEIGMLSLLWGKLGWPMGWIQAKARGGVEKTLSGPARKVQGSSASFEKSFWPNCLAFGTTGKIVSRVSSEHDARSVSASRWSDFRQGNKNAMGSDRSHFGTESKNAVTVSLLGTDERRTQRKAAGKVSRSTHRPVDHKWLFRNGASQWLSWKHCPGHRCFDGSILCWEEAPPSGFQSGRVSRRHRFASAPARQRHYHSDRCSCIRTACDRFATWT